MKTIIKTICRKSDQFEKELVYLLNDGYEIIRCGCKTVDVQFGDNMVWYAILKKNI